LNGGYYSAGGKVYKNIYHLVIDFYKFGYINSDPDILWGLVKEQTSGITICSRCCKRKDR